MTMQPKTTRQEGSRAAHIVVAARDLLTRQVNFLEGFRALVALGYEPNGYDYAPGFSFIFWFNSVTAHLPDQAVRAQCTPAFLERSDAELKQFEVQYGDRIDQACRELLERFGKAT